MRDKMEGIREFFTRYECAGVVLPDGWFGRPHDSYYELRWIRESFEYLTIRFKYSPDLSIIRPRGMLIVHSRSPKLVIEKCDGGVLSSSDPQHGGIETQVFTEGPVELHAPRRIVPGVAWGDQPDDKEIDDQFN